MRRHLTAALALAAAAGVLVGSPAQAKPSPLQDLRTATARFHSLDQATAAGYGLFTDKDGIACIDNPAGAMGIHYVKGALVGDGAVEASTPEAMIYQPTPDGGMRLVAVEYVVFQADWDAHHADPPRLFDTDFTPVGADNRYGIPPFYELHVWAWKTNPAGTFEDWNPTVTCG